MRKLSLLLLAVLALALWGCNEDTPFQATTPEAAVPSTGEAPPDYVIDHHELTDKLDPLGGQSNVLVILANFYDTPTGSLLGASQLATIDGYMFDTEGDGYSVDELYEEMSFGAASLSGQTVGPFTIPSSINDTCCYSGWGDEAYTAAEQSGIDMTQYDAFIYVYPNGNYYDGIGWGGVAYGGNKIGIFKWFGVCNYAHELGHLYGLAHSGTPTGGEYADLSCIMSTSWGPNGWLPLRQCNAVWKYNRGWLDANEVVTIDGPGVYTYYLAPSEVAAGDIVNPPGADAEHLLVIDTGFAPNPAPTHYISFRQAEGAFDTAGAMTDYVGRVHVHTKSGRTDRQAMLTLGQTYDAGAFTVTCESDGTNGADWVEVTVEVFDPQCDNCFDSDITPTYVYSKTQPKYFCTGWTLSVTNQDDPGCADNTYVISGNCSDPDLDFGSNGSMVVAAGATGTTPLILQPLGTLAEDVYPFTVNVSESGGCVGSTSYTRYFVLDGTAPTAPTGCDAWMTLNETAEISWNASSDATAGVDYYQVFCNDTLIGTSTTTDFVHQGVQWNYRYTYKVRAIDKAGNISGWSNEDTIGCPKCPIPQEL